MTSRLLFFAITRPLSSWCPCISCRSSCEWAIAPTGILLNNKIPLCICSGRRPWRSQDADPEAKERQKSEMFSVVFNQIQIIADRVLPTHQNVLVASTAAASLVKMEANLDIFAAQWRHLPQSADFLHFLVLRLVFPRLRQHQLLASVFLGDQVLC